MDVLRDNCLTLYSLKQFPETYVGHASPIVPIPYYALYYIYDPLYL